MKNLTLTIIITMAASFAAFGQAQPTDPARGAVSGSSMSVSDIETINLTNGNLMLNMPLVSLPKSRGGLSASLGYMYNSKLYKPIVGEIAANNTVSDQNLLYQSDSGGWRLVNSLDYALVVNNRFDDISEIDCNAGDVYAKNGYRWQVKVRFPDGSEKEFKPLGYSSYYEDGYYNVSPNGLLKNYGHTYYPGPPPTHVCNDSSSQLTSAMVYYTTDGSYLRMVIDHDYDGEPTNNPYTIYFPDGSYYQSSTRKVTDRYGNFIQPVSFTYDGKTATGIEDNVGRRIFTTNGSQSGELYVYQLGFNGEEIRWTIKEKTIYVRREYTTTPNPGLRDRGGNSATIVYEDSMTVLDEIIQPSALGGQKFEFEYYGSDTAPGSGQYSSGWGEISSVEMPTGAVVSYEYRRFAENTDKVLDSSVKKKTLTYLAEYDGSSSSVSDIWDYYITSTTATVTGPDGGVTSQSHGNTSYKDAYSGLVKAIESPNGTKIEKIYGFYGSASYGHNSFVKTEYTSIKNAAGTYSLTAIKTFTQDRNGNNTSVSEYDFIPYGDVHDVYGSPTAIPSNVSPSRVTYTSYYNATPDSSDTTTSSSYNYWDYSNIKNVVASIDIRNASNQTVSKTEFTYDNYSTTANPILTRTWDSTKGSLTTPLTDTNSVKTQATYHSTYGFPLTTTDANGVVTTYTYGCIDGSTGGCSSTAPDNLYPTKTEVASNYSSLMRTSSAKYDYYTSVVTEAKDVDNDIATVTEYDDLGRPTKVRSADGKILESWTRTTYDDVNRRVIVESDLETKGDYKKVATQFFDQLGRVRLAKTLEVASTQSATNETDGIKVQTRYKTVSGFTYQLTSNPYRASTSSAEIDATMGWTLSTGWSSGIRSEVQTFAGAGLPTAFGGSNTTSTGIVRTDIDANRTLVTDQASKQRISKTSALGQLTDVYEIMTSSDASTSSVTFPNTSIAYGYVTSYVYDTLNNLTTVNQGSQSRAFAYNSLSRLTSATNPESGTISYVYDNNGNLTSKTDARSITTSYVYDVLNRVTDRNYTNEPSGSETADVDYFYGTTAPKVGKLTKVTSSVSTTEYTSFDILGRVTGHKQTTDGVDYTTGYTYKLSGALDEQTYPSGRVVKNEIDVSGDLASVSSKENSSAIFKTYANDFTYNAAGAVSSLKLGNGRFESTTFNSRLQPTQIGLGTSETTQNILKLEYGYGTTANNGNVLSQTITVPTVGSNTGFAAVQTYTYDELNRLKSGTENVTPNGGSQSQSWKQTYTFDRYGNRRFDFTGGNTTSPASSCTDAICNPTISTTNNRLTSTGYLYDDAGNTTRDAEYRTFTYDGENKQTLVKYSSNATIGEYFYDGDGKRVKKVVPSTGETTVFVYDAAGKLIGDYSTVVASANDAKVAYLTSDHLGSQRITTDAIGQTSSRRDFMPFGEEISRSGYGSDTVREKFATYKRDEEINLDYAQARAYSNNLGRFTSTDPVFTSKKHPSQPQRWNLYIYVISNPLAYTDPDGLKPKRVIDVFLTSEYADMKAWKGVQKWAKKHGAVINIFTAKDGTATLDQFKKSIGIENRTTIVIGHSVIPPSDIEAAHNGTASAGGKGVGLDFVGGQLASPSAASKGLMIGFPTLEGVEAKAKNIVVLSCDFGDTFAPLGSSKKTNFLWGSGGGDGLGTTLGSIDKIGRKMAEVFARGGSAREAQGAGSAVFDLAPASDGDTVIREVLQPFEVKEKP